MGQSACCSPTSTMQQARGISENASIKLSYLQKVYRSHLGSACISGGAWRCQQKREAAAPVIVNALVHVHGACVLHNYADDVFTADCRSHGACLRVHALLGSNQLHRFSGLFLQWILWRVWVAMIYVVVMRWASVSADFSGVVDELVHLIQTASPASSCRCVRCPYTIASSTILFFNYLM